MSNIRTKVMEFHAVGKIPVLPYPKVPDDSRVKLRTRLITEEYFELMLSIFGKDEATLREIESAVNNLIENEKVFTSIVKLADSTIDLDYVVEGTRLEFGINGEPLLNEVHRCNMKKFGFGSRTREDGKILKPAGWLAPEINRLLLEQV